MASQIHLYQPVSEKIVRHSLDNSIPAIEQLHQNLTGKGYNFLRNQKIGNYNFDFYCPELKIAIDIDGYAHEYSGVYNRDEAKKLYISSLGIVVFRFTDHQILVDVEEIYRALKNHINTAFTV